MEGEAPGWKTTWRKNEREEFETPIRGPGGRRWCEEKSETSENVFERWGDNFYFHFWQVVTPSSFLQPVERQGSPVKFRWTFAPGGTNHRSRVLQAVASALPQATQLAVMIDVVVPCESSSPERGPGKWGTHHRTTSASVGMEFLNLHYALPSN